MFTLCVSSVLDSKYVQFRIICTLLCTMIVDTFETDSQLIHYEKRLVQFTNWWVSLHVFLSKLSGGQPQMY